jgi:hypothetical protein
MPNTCSFSADTSRLCLEDDEREYIGTKMGEGESNAKQEPARENVMRTSAESSAAGSQCQ